MDPIGSVARLRRYPVKSMLGEDVETSYVTERGLLGDRAFALIDAETGKLASAKRPKLWGALLGFGATFDGELVLDEPIPPARITFPDGSVRSSEDPGLEGTLAEVLGRKVRVAASHEEMLFLEEVWRGDLKDDVEPYGPAIGEEDGHQLIDVPASLLAPEGFFDAGAVHLITTSTLRRLGELQPESRFEAERFRPNLVLDIPDDGFVENDWPDRTLDIGDAVRIRVVMPVPRCVMTTLRQGDLPADADVLRTITQHNKVETMSRMYPCAGVYAEVVQGGEIRVGDAVRLV